MAIFSFLELKIKSASRTKRKSSLVQFGCAGWKVFTVTYRKIYQALDYSIQDVEESAGAPIALSSDKVEVLMGRMRNPSLSLHGIEGAFSGVGAKTVIPAKVSGKFSIRLVISPIILSLVSEIITGSFLPKRQSPSTHSSFHTLRSYSRGLIRRASSRLRACMAANHG